MIKTVMLNQLCMSIWQVEIYQATIWSGPAGDIFQQKIDKIFKDVFCIADDILIVWYDADGRDHDKPLRKVMHIYCLQKIKLKKNK